MAVLVRVLVFTLSIIGAISKPQSGLATFGASSDNCEFLMEIFSNCWSCSTNLCAFHPAGVTPSGEPIPDCVRKERVEPPIGTYKCCCIQGDQCPNPFENDKNPFAPQNESPNPPAEQNDESDPFADPFTDPFADRKY